MNNRRMGKLWQRNYYEHIIRNNDEMNRIREYIINNPSKWDEDNTQIPIGSSFSEDLRKKNS